MLALYWRHRRLYDFKSTYWTWYSFERIHAINKSRGHEAIHKIKPSDDKLFVQIGQSAAKDFRDAVLISILDSRDVLTRMTKFHGIGKGLSANFDAAL